MAKRQTTRSPARSETAKEKSAASTATATKVLQVRDGICIYWPNGDFRGAGERVDPMGIPPGSPVPYRVDADDPYIQSCLHKFVDAPEGSVPVPRSTWPRHYRVAQEQGEDGGLEARQVADEMSVREDPELERPELDKLSALADDEVVEEPEETEIRPLPDDEAPGFERELPRE